MIRLGSTTHFSSPQHIYDWIFGKYEWGNEPTYTKVTWNCRNSIEGLNKPKINNCQLWRSLFPEACERLKVFFSFFLSGVALSVTRRFWSQAWMLKANPFSWQTSGWPARTIQHEMDHRRVRLHAEIMARSTFTCKCWEKVSTSGDRMYVPFAPKWRVLNVHLTISD